MEPLKEMFNPAYYAGLAEHLKQVYPAFASEKFLKQAIGPLKSLSLNERMRHTGVVLHQHLPADYEKTMGILKETIPLLKPGYTNLVFPDFVSQFGTAKLKTSLEALHYFTRFGSSEFAIRTFLKSDFDETIGVLYKWSEDENEHVRRLASEGSRPRLPWSFNYTKDAKISIRRFKLNTDTIKIGDAITFQFELASKASKTQKLMIDYRIHYVKKGGSTSPKVFKLKEINLAANESVSISKKQSFQDFTTRKHFPGKHKIEVLVNGKVVKSVSFQVKKRN